MCEPRYNRANNSDVAKNQSPCHSMVRRPLQNAGHAVSEFPLTAPLASSDPCARSAEQKALEREAARAERREIAQARHEALEARREALQWRKENGPFVAQETGARYQPACANYELKTREKRFEARRPMDQSTVTDSERFLRRLAERPTIDPNQEEPVVIDGERLSAYKAAMLQSLAKGCTRVRGGGGS